MSEWSGTGGKHWGIIAESFGMLLERSVEPEMLHRLSACANVGEVLDALVSRGIAALPGFCLVGFDGDRVTAYVRGGFSFRAEASWHDALTEKGEGVRTWREMTVEGVSRFAMLSPDEWHRTELPLRSFEGERQRIVHGVQGLSLAVCEQLTEEEVPLMTTTQQPSRETTSLDRGAEILSGSTGVAERAEQVSDTLFAEIFGDIVQNDEAGVSEDDDFTDTTQLVAGSQGLDSGPHDTAPVTQVRPHGWLVLPGGDELPITGLTLLGRNPRDDNDSGAELVAVFDPNGNISRTHARVRPADGGVVLEDLESTNGTLLVTNDDEVLLRAGLEMQLKHGDRIILGGDAQLEYRDRP
ncbi:FHA domain-containing protein [Leucobacter chinensis]|uniref:FHA domain-containing protein n=1 Tax=Leucobacter chinensis TaxID=2851010 RepID=UPI001C230C24|nr:FHA domain-containing protein [Leucobacter chinensis]